MRAPPVSKARPIAAKVDRVIHEATGAGGDAEDGVDSKFYSFVLMGAVVWNHGRTAIQDRPLRARANSNPLRKYGGDL